MDIITSILTAGVLLVVVSGQDGVIEVKDCPLGCSCTGSTITCTGLSLFPASLPKETTEFTMSGSRIGIVPMNVFLDLPRLERIEMSRMNIDTIRACSLAELENMTEIVFTHVNVSVIEGNAFSNLVNISRLTFRDSVISDLRSYSIHGARGIGTLSFVRTTIRALHPYSILLVDTVDAISFEGCTIGEFRYKGIDGVTGCDRFVLRNCTVEAWQCGTLDSFTTTGSRISVTESRFTCDCGLAWLWDKYATTPVLQDTSNRCRNSGQRLSAQTIDDVCPVAGSRDTGCRPRLPSPPHSCSRHFDSPITAEDKIDYPTYFDPRDENACSVQVVYRILVFFSVSIHFLLK